MDPVTHKVVTKATESALWIVLAVVSAAIGWVTYDYLKFRKERKVEGVVSPAVVKEAVETV